MPPSHAPHLLPLLRAAAMACAVLALPSAQAQSTSATANPDTALCSQRADANCWQTLALPGSAGQLRYLASQHPGSTAPSSALLVMHGHPRDAGRSFEAGLAAARGAGQLAQTLVVAPLYQVADAERCHSPGMPQASPGDALWTCASWLAGKPSEGEHPITSFAALDALVQALHSQWPTLRSITLAGFSAGAQMLQHSVGFAAAAPAGITLRYVIADPGSWLYFDPVRPQPQRGGQDVDWSACSGPEGAGSCEFRFTQPDPAACPGYDHWKYGVQRLPAALPHSAAQARARYAQVHIEYLEGALDSGTDKAAYYRILDKSCAAQLQGPFRLQRGLAYLAYERSVLQPATPRRLTVVPGCAHNVACVLPSAAARPALFPAP